MGEIEQEQIDDAVDVVTDMLSGATDLNEDECHRLATKIVKRVMEEIDPAADEPDEDEPDEPEDPEE